MSSVAELKRAYSDEVSRQPYSLDAFERIDPSPHQFHDQLFVLDSYDQLEHSLDDWTHAQPPRELAQ